ncbi:MAG: peptidoglycan DD-metalloendopeptidase family protein [Desulfobacterales bacterium]|nr:peptidoglycan DD-metalloendopeptidase family protein [Desulfobacterales bacterium]
MLYFLKTTFKIIILPFLILWIGFSTAAYPASGPSVGIIKASDLNVRPVPGSSMAPIFKLQKGTRVDILEDTGKWLKISYKSQTGFIIDNSDYIEIISLGSGKDEEVYSVKAITDDINKKIETRQAEIERITRDEKNIVKNLNNLDLSIDKTVKQASRTRSELLALSKKIDENMTAYDTLTASIKTQEEYLSVRLVALYKLNQVGAVHFLSTADSMFELFQRKKSLEHILSHDESVLNRYLVEKEKTTNLLKKLNEQKKQKLAKEAEYNKQIKALSEDRNKRSSILVNIRDKKSLEMAVIKALEEAAKNLDHAIDKMDLEPGFIVHEKLKPSNRSFADSKGLLNGPVNGKIISSYGAYRNKKYNIESFRSGIDIAAKRGDPVKAVSYGEVIFADWFKGYGNMIIVDHGKSYCTVYAHVEEMFKAKGDVVATDEVIATTGDSGSITGTGLYFEVRHHGKPVDPLKWIKKG